MISATASVRTTAVATGTLSASPIAISKAGLIRVASVIWLG